MADIADRTLQSLADRIFQLTIMWERLKHKLQEALNQSYVAPSFLLDMWIRDRSWRDALSDEFETDYFKKIQALLKKDYEDGKNIFPPRDKIFNAFNLTPLPEVKVVILGQDPYPQDGQAEGLAFSVPDGMNKPRSLINIFEVLEKDIPGFQTPSSGSLVKWAQKGVFLLNSTLTVEADKPNSHKDYGWQKLTHRVIKVISDQCPFVVFILWGEFAHKKEKLIDGDKHFVIKDAHPSPLSFRMFKDWKCFSKTNAALQSKGLTAIDWSL